MSNCLCYNYGIIFQFPIYRLVETDPTFHLRSTSISLHRNWYNSVAKIGEIQIYFLSVNVLEMLRRIPG